MTLAKLNIPQILFIVIAAVVFSLIVFLILFFSIRKRYIRKKYQEHYYKKIYQIAFNQDYYLINNFLFRIDNSTVMGIDHILFGDRYIYLILDYYYDGDLIGNAEDKSLVFVNRKGTKQYTDNPFLNSEKIMNRLSMITSIDPSLLIGVILVNDSCECFVKSSSKHIYLSQRKYLKMLIKNIESREVGKINASQLDSAVKAIYRLNRRRNK